MKVEITTELFAVPELDANGERGFSLLLSVKASDSADDTHWKALAAAGKLSDIGVFAPWRFAAIEIGIGKTGQVPAPAVMIQAKSVNDATRDSLRAELDRRLLTRAIEASASFALAADTDGERFSVPRFLAGLSTQTAPFNREVFQTACLVRIADPGAGMLVATIAFTLPDGTKLPLPTTPGTAQSDSDADGASADMDVWNSGVSFQGAEIWLHARHLGTDAPSAGGWTNAPEIDFWSTFERQMHDKAPGEITPTAHPIYVRVQADTAAQADAAGALLFMRSFLSGESVGWQCLNACRVQDAVETVSPSPLVDTVLKPDSAGKLASKFKGVEMRYDAAPMFRPKSPIGPSVEGAWSGTDVDTNDSLLTLLDSDDAWSREPALGFGMMVQAATLIIGNAGVLPADLWSGDGSAPHQDPTHQDPTRLRPHTDAWQPPASSITTQVYLRRVPVLPCLLDTRLHTVSGMPPLAAADPLVLAERAELALSELSAALFPALEKDMPTTHALLLEGVGAHRTLVLRAPNTGHSVLDRWLVTDERQASDGSKDRIKEARAGYLEAYWTLQEIEIEKQSAHEKAQMQFADPAVQALHLELFAAGTVGNKAVASMTVSLARADQHADLQDGASVDQLCRNSWSNALRLEIGIGSVYQVSVPTPDSDGTLKVRIDVPMDSFGLVRIHVGIPKTQWTDRIHPGLQSDFAPDGAAVAHAWVAPRVLKIESASKYLPTPAELHAAFEINETDSALAVRYRAPASIHAKNIGRFELSAQHWRWDGRGASELPRHQSDFDAEPSAGSSPASNSVLWEATQFVERLGRAPQITRLLAPMMAIGAAPVALHLETIPATVGEQFARFSVRAVHRYRELLRGQDPRGEFTELAKKPFGSGGTDFDPYLRARRSAPERDSPVPTPSLALQLPLFSSLFEPAGAAIEPAADMLIVTNEAWFQQGGLSERLEVEIEPIVRELCPSDGDGWPNCPGEKPKCPETQSVTRAETGADPLLSAALSLADGKLPTLRLSGPFGLSFDNAISTRRQIGAAFAVATSAAAFEMSKLRSRRVLEPAAFVSYDTHAASASWVFSDEELRRFHQTGQVILDLHDANAGAMPILLRLGDFHLRISSDRLEQILVEKSKPYPALIGIAAATGSQIRIALTREFPLRDDVMPGIWSLRISSRQELTAATGSDARTYAPWQAWIAAEISAMARPNQAAFEFHTAPAKTWARTIAHRYSNWTPGRWIQFWPKRDCLTPSGKKLFDGVDDWTKLALVPTNENGDFWQIIEQSRNPIAHQLIAEIPNGPVAGDRLFHLVLVTRRVASAAGSRLGEIYLSMLQVADGKRLKVIPGLPPIPTDTDLGQLRARVLLIQRKPGVSGAGNIWSRLFPDSATADAELRILGISPHLGNAP